MEPSIMPSTGRELTLLRISFGFCPFLASLVLMQVKIFRLFAEKSLGLVCKILTAFNRLFPRKVESRLPGKCLERSQPRWSLRGQSFQRDSNVCVTVRIHVEIRSQFVHQCRQVLQFFIKP